MQDSSYQMFDIELKKNLISSEFSGTILLDKNGIMVYVSDFMCSLLEYEIEDLQNYHIIKILNPAVHDKVFSLIADSFARPGLYQSFWKVYKRNGNYLRCLISGSLTNIQGIDILIVTIMPIQKEVVSKSYSILLSPLAPINRYQELYGNSESLISVINHNGLLVYVNQAVLNTARCESDKIVGRSIFEFFHPDDLEKVSKLFTENIDKPNVVVQFNCRARFRANNWHWWSYTHHNLLFNPEIKGIVSYAQKISDQIQTYSSEDYYKEIIDGIQHPIVVVDLREETIVECNLSAIEDFNLPQQLVVTFEEFARHIQWEVSTIESLSREIINKNNKEPYCECITVENNSVITNYRISYHQYNQGKTDLLVIYFNNITSETIFRNSLTLEYIKYEYLFNNILSASLYFNNQYLILEANTFLLKQYDYNLTQIVNSKIDTLYHSDNLEKLYALIRRAQNNPYTPLQEKFEKLTRNRVSFQSIDTIVFIPISQGDIFLLLSEPISLASVTNSRFQETYHELLSLYSALPDMYFKLRADSSCIEFRVPIDYQKFIKTDAIKGSYFYQILSYQNIEEVQESINQCITTNQPVRIVFDITYTHKEYFEVRFIPFQEQEVVAIVRLVTRSVEDERKIKQALIEKEVLVREVHHRVKNNLQIISSLLSLQSASIPDRKIQEKIIESQSRIRIMAMVHEKLYQALDFSLVSLKDFAESLSHFCVRTYAKGKNIHLKVNIINCLLPIDTCINVGLFLHETICNSVKHAFNESIDLATISVDLKTKNGFYILSVQDNGIGVLPEHTSPKVTSLGMQLIRTTARQLSGTLTIEVTQGTTINVAFPI